MPEWRDEAIVLSARAHGETGAIMSLLTREHGRAMGYFYGATATRNRGLLEIGNRVAVSWTAKAQGQLGVFALELEKTSSADVLGEARKLTALQSAMALADRTLPEGERHAGVFEATKALLAAFGGDAWAAAYIYWELGLLRELGFGLDLSSCAATGEVENLIYVSPRSGRAVSAAAGEIYKEKLLPLPSFLRGDGVLDDAEILSGLRLTGHFLRQRVFSQAHSDLPEPRLRLEERFTVSI